MALARVEPASYPRFFDTVMLAARVQTALRLFGGGGVWWAPPTAVARRRHEPDEGEFGGKMTLDNPIKRAAWAAQWRDLENSKGGGAAIDPCGA